ncbi:MAG: cell division protein FtsL [Hyphomonadaceae bacterium]
MRRALHILAAILIVVLVVGLYRAKSDAAKTQQHVRALQSEITEREAALRELRAEIAELESPARVARLAEQHGMIIGAEGAALPESEIDDRLPAPRATKVRP